MIVFDRQAAIKSVIYRVFSAAILYAVFRSVKLVVSVELLKLVQYYVFERVYGGLAYRRITEEREEAVAQTAAFLHDERAFK